MKKRLLSLALAIVMCLSMAAPASAVSPSNARWEYGKYIVNNITYDDFGDLNPGPDEKPFQVYEKMLRHYFPSEDANLAELWLRLGLWIGLVHKYSSAPFEPLQKACYDTDGPMDLMVQDEYEHYYWGDHGFNVYTSGLRLANSVKQANEQVAGFAKWAYKKQSSHNVSWAPSDLKNMEKNEYERTQPVFWLEVRASKNTGSASQGLGHGAGLAAIFYNFRFQPVLPNQEDKETNYSCVPVGDPIVSPHVERTQTINDTNSTTVATQQLSSSMEATITTGFTRSSEFAWGSSLSVGSEWGASVGPLNASQSFEVTTSISQAISEAWSEESSHTTAKGKETSVQVDMQPYTRVQLESSETQQEYRTSWNGPVELQFDVAFIDCGLGLDNGEPCVSKVIAKFPQGNITDEPKSARASLMYRYENRELLKDIDWGGMQWHSERFHYPQGNRDCTSNRVLNFLRYNAPSLYRMENLKSVYTIYQHKAANLTALYPLTKIQSTNVSKIQLSKGGSYDLEDPAGIQLEGLNRYNAPFFNFSQNEGHWVICDQYGNPTDSNIAYIKNDPNTGRQTLYAGRGNGTTFMKFMIDESYYKDEHVYSGESFSNSSIDSKPISVTVLASNFHDVHANQYFYKPVYWAVSEGITAGLNKTTFGPNENCTREQVATFLWRYEKEPAPQGRNPFRDVYAGHYAYAPIVWAAERGIASGISPNTFAPKDPVTRAQFVSMLWRLAGQPQPRSTTSPFRDVSPNSWYGKAVLWAVENGVAAGAGAGIFNPNGLCSRAQVVSFLYRYDSIK